MSNVFTLVYRNETNGNQMESKVKEILEVAKKTSLLPVPLTKKGKTNLIKLQGEYAAKHGHRITIKSLASRIFETASLPVK